MHAFVLEPVYVRVRVHDRANESERATSEQKQTLCQDIPKQKLMSNLVYICFNTKYAFLFYCHKTLIQI